MIHISLALLPPRDELALQWQALEQRSDASFFLSWSWISCWLDSLENSVELHLLRVTDAGRVVALGLLAKQLALRHGVILSRSLRLHATGRPRFDILTAECNGFLIERHRESDLLPQILTFLFNSDSSLDELMMEGLWHRPGTSLTCLPALRSRSRHINNHYVELDRVRQTGDYLRLISANTRHQIRRSSREYATLGPLTLRTPSDPNEALRFLEGLEQLHQPYWRSRGQQGAFASKFFRSFHRTLVQNAFCRGEIQLLSLDAGGRRLGYLYNFVYRDRVYNYQSGFDYNICERHNRPGLVIHSTAIAMNAENGRTVYDFLAGDSQYKRMLGTAKGTMSWLTLQRDRLRFRAEDRMRELHRRLSSPLASRRASA